MTFLATPKTGSGARTAAAPAGTVALAALAFGNHVAERRHPPRGAFIEVNGVRLHYSDRSERSPEAEKNHDHRRIAASPS